MEDFLRHYQVTNRFGTPVEIANTVPFMAGDKSSFMWTTNISVDGAKYVMVAARLGKSANLELGRRNEKSI